MTRGQRDLTPEWCDHVAVARALAGRPVGRTLHHAEQIAVARHVIANGDGSTRLMSIVGCNGTHARDLINEAHTTTRPADRKARRGEVLAAAHRVMGSAE